MKKRSFLQKTIFNYRGLRYNFNWDLILEMKDYGTS